eukprot:4176019-Karenia_brevis.AAC.1
MAHNLIPRACLEKIEHRGRNSKKKHKQIFLRDTYSLSMVGAEWYAANEPDPTPLRRSAADQIACAD